MERGNTSRTGAGKTQHLIEPKMEGKKFLQGLPEKEKAVADPNLAAVHGRLKFCGAEKQKVLLSHRRRRVSPTSLT